MDKDRDKKNSLLYMVLILTLITFISAAGLSVVNGIVQEPIRQSQMQETLKAIRDVLPEYDNDPFEDQKTIEYNEKPIIVYPGKNKGNLTGIAFEISSNSGYGGKITILAGIKVSDHTLNGIYVLSHAETPGLGDKMRDKNWQDRELKGKAISSQYSFRVKKDGGDIDALTAATITSRAVCEALNTTYNIYSAFIAEYSAEQISQQEEPNYSEGPDREGDSTETEEISDAVSTEDPTIDKEEEI